jgi:hypothetical protein
MDQFCKGGVTFLRLMRSFRVVASLMQEEHLLGPAVASTASTAIRGAAILAGPAAILGGQPPSRHPQSQSRHLQPNILLTFDMHKYQNPVNKRLKTVPNHWYRTHSPAGTVP